MKTIGKIYAAVGDVAISEDESQICLILDSTALDVASIEATVHHKSILNSQAAQE